MYNEVKGSMNCFKRNRGLKKKGAGQGTCFQYD